MPGLEDVVIDTTPKSVEVRRLSADLYIEVSITPEGFEAIYSPQAQRFASESRQCMLEEHVRVIADIKPKTVVVRTPEADVFLPQDVVAAIVEGRLGARDLLIQGGQ